MTAALAIEDRVVATFDTDLQGATDGGGVMKTITWSPEDAQGKPGSGSAYVTVYWTNTAPGWQDSKVNINDPPPATDLVWPGVDCRLYVNLEFDVKIDVTNSFLANNGTYGGIQVVLQGWAGANNNPNNIGWVGIGSVTLANTNGWVHYKVPLSSFPYNANRIVLNTFVNPGTNTICYFIDNIVFTVPPSPPPTMSLQPATSNPGLQLIAGPSGDYPRQMIRTLFANGEYSWIGRGATPVTYSMTITNYPAPPVTNFQTHILLIPDNPGTGTSPDWGETNTVALMIENHLNGTASGYFRYKTNLPNGNSMMYNANPDNGPVGHLATVEAPTPIGTWSLTFLNDTNVTINGPGGSSATCTLPPDAAALFASGMAVYFGNQPNGAWKNGQFSTLSRVQISGTWAPNIDDSFTGTEVDTNLWEKIGGDAKGIRIATSQDAYWLSWTTPDPGFDVIQATASLSPIAWTDTALKKTDAFVRGEQRILLVPKSALPSQDSGYFRLIKRVASKLQVLLPGETAAPSTPTGITRTPTPHAFGVAFDITVRAVDDNWSLVPITDTVRITSDEPFAGLPLDASLVGGEATFSVMLNQPGTWTITATDVTDNAKAPGTSSPVTVN